MVDPISLVAISALSGVVLGKISKKERIVEQIIEEDKSPEFVAINSGVRSSQLLPYLSIKKSIFINTAKIQHSNEKSEFMSELKALIKEEEYSISKISLDLYYLIPKEEKINIRNLIHEEALQSTIYINNENIASSDAE